LKMALAKKKLLLADDESNIRLLTKKIFEDDYEVVEAKNGREAIDLATKHIPAIILLDIMMPTTDGLTALTALKNDKRTSSIPVIMLTGAGHELNEKLAISLGAQAYLRKPVSPKQLTDEISSIVRRDPIKR